MAVSRSIVFLHAVGRIGSHDSRIQYSTFKSTIVHDVSCNVVALEAAEFGQMTKPRGVVLTLKLLKTSHLSTVSSHPFFTTDDQSAYYTRFRRATLLEGKISLTSARHTPILQIPLQYRYYQKLYHHARRAPTSHCADCARECSAQCKSRSTSPS